MAEDEMEEILRQGQVEDEASTSKETSDSIERCIKALVHACMCRNSSCRLMSCFKMKRVVAHTKVCKKRAELTCPVCKQLIALCCYHAKNCGKAECVVPFCLDIRKKVAARKPAAAAAANGQE